LVKRTDNIIFFFFVFLLSTVVFADVEFNIRQAGPFGKKPVLAVAVDAGHLAAQDSIRALYIREGYLMCEVETEVESLSSGDVVVNVEVSSGPRSTVAEYGITGYPREGVVHELPLRVSIGKAFREADLAADMELLARRLEDTGYPFARVSVESLAIGPMLNDSLPVMVTLKVVPGDSVAIGAIVLNANARTKPYVVEKTMLIERPECFSESRLRKGIERLNDLAYLSVVGEAELLLDESGTWLLRLNIVEERTALVNGILGYAPRHEEGGLSGHLDATFYNMWGTGRNLVVLWDQTAGEHLRIGATYTEPWIFGGAGDLSITGEFYDRDSTYSERSFSAEYKLPLSFSLSGLFGFSYRGVLPDSIGQQTYAIPRSKEYGISVGLSWEALRPRVNPRKGIDISLRLAPLYVERSGPDYLFDELERYEPFLRAETDFASAVEALRGNVLYIGLHGRSVFSGSLLPISDQYYLGGWQTLRGYREEQFSAEHLVWGNLEWRVLLGDYAQAFAFLDAAVMKSSDTEFDDKIGYGVGFRLPTAIGRWDIAYGVGGGESLTGGLIHVGLRTGL